MLTLESLKQYGANVEEGLNRCLNNEAFYLRLVEMAIRDDKITELGSLLESGDLASAFEVAHSLKGTLGNLSLSPVYRPVSELTEILRGKTQADYLPLWQEILAQKKKLDDLL